MSRIALCAAIVSAGLAIVISAAADDSEAPSDPGALFASGITASHRGRPTEAIASFEALADRGIVDAVASYDRGLAYASRVRIGAELPGDLGRAAHGFEEARELSRDPRLVEDATRALAIVRGEVARRRLRAGQSIEVDPGRSIARSLARLLSEGAWTLLCAAASLALSASLFVRWLARPGPLRVGAGVTAGVSLPVLALAVAMTLAVRHDRLSLREAVIVTADARTIDPRGMAIAGAASLPEGARVEIVDDRGATIRVRFGTTDAWVSSAALRELARRD
ncbi:MAG: hypothetical protein ABSC94_09880 [Polyangiaceae bacterium]|jgi:hypothetical protein